MRDSKILKKFCHNKKVILVGNASSLMKKRLGEQIDQFDVVVRINKGHPTEDNEVHFGQKTNIWATSCASSIYDEWKRLFLHVKHVVFPNMRITSFQPKDAYLNKTKNYRRLIREFGYERPSTGLLTADFLINIGKVPRLYCAGFDFFQSRTWYRNSEAHGPHQPEREKHYMLDVLNVKPI